MTSLSILILAAGKSVRLNSALPKVLHRLGGRPLIEYALEAAQAVTETQPVLIIGHGAEAVRAALGERATYVTQAEQLGTGHAVQQAESILKNKSDYVLVTYGDMPLLRAETLHALVEAQMHNSGPLTLLTINSEKPSDFGRIVRDAVGGNVRAVVEVAQATLEQKRLTELNVGAYCFKAAWLWDALPRLPLSPKGEYYLTDIVPLAADSGHIATITLADETEVIGVNTRAQLAEAEAALRRRVNEKWLAAGVTLVDPATTYIEPTAQLGRDTCLLPNTHIGGRSVIGEDCVIGPNTIVRDTVIGNRCRVECSVLEQASLADEVDVGPFSHLRPGARLERGVHLGNFGEVKNSTLGPGTLMGHFSYVGDATVGAGVNIGAGTITCNFDGVKKNPTVIEDGAFVGSDSLLVAPVKIGRKARTGAGAVVTKDVPPDSLAVGMPARVIRKLNA